MFQDCFQSKTHAFTDEGQVKRQAGKPRRALCIVVITNHVKDLMSYSLVRGKQISVSEYTCGKIS